MFKGLNIAHCPDVFNFLLKHSLGDPKRGVVYYRIVVPPGEESRICLCFGKRLCRELIIR